MPQFLKRRWLKEFWCLAAAGLAFLIYKGFVGPRLMPVLTAHNLASTMPVVNVVLQPLTDLRPSAAPGTTITAYGNAFEVPWKGSIQQRVVHNFTVILFASHDAVLVRPSKLGTDLTDVISSDRSASYAKLRALFYDDQTKSAYDREFAELSVAPSQVRFFDPPRLSTKRAILLLDKGITESDGLTGLYQFETSSARGFQFGNPTYAPHVQLDFFNPAGDFLVEVTCVFGKGASARGIQAEVNRIIQTFHPVANSASALPANSPRLTPTKPPDK